MLHTTVDTPITFSPQEIFCTLRLSQGIIGALTASANKIRKILFMNEVITEMSIKAFPFAPTRFQKKVPSRETSVK